MIKTIKIDGYLLQNKLESALKQIVLSSWRGREVTCSKSKKRWDMVYQQGQNLIAVEYDGDSHYKDSLVIKRDREKDLMAKELNMHVIRFPYWIQLTNTTLKHFFNLEANIEQTFPHGFITTKIFPASFCELGTQRFKNEIEALPLVVKKCVIDSLKEKISCFGIEFVLPSTLYYLVEE
jgi:hypothetical protein